MLALARLINQWYKDYQFRIIVVYGASGMGKSVYAWKILQEIYPNQDVRKYLVFKPQEIINFIKNLYTKDIRIKSFLIDDAGVWLGADDYADPFVQAVTKQVQLLRTVCSSVILTTPSLKGLVKKLRTQDLFTVKITKSQSGPYREAVGYYTSYRADGKRWMVKRYIDPFKSHLDDKLYSWYDRVRKDYAREGIRLMEEGLKMREAKREYFLRRAAGDESA